MTLSRKLTAEFIGTLLLVAAVVGSGIMGERLSGGNEALALLANTLATGAILAVIILMFGEVSGAHFNPAVTLAFLIRRQIGGGDAALYVAVQVAGGIAGALLAHIMFSEPLVDLASTERAGAPLWLAEVVATAGLVGAIFACLRFRPAALPYAVALVISAGYWFTSSTSFANPAVTIARSLSDTFSGIRPEDAPFFIVAQVVGAILATYLFRWLLADTGAARPASD